LVASTVYTVIVTAVKSSNSTFTASAPFSVRTATPPPPPPPPTTITSLNFTKQNNVNFVLDWAGGKGATVFTFIIDSVVKTTRYIYIGSDGGNAGFNYITSGPAKRHMVYIRATNSYGSVSSPTIGVYY
jgi:hypothetical protein